MAKPLVTAWCALLFLLSSGGLPECQPYNAPTCIAPDGSAPCAYHFENGADLWAHVGEVSGHDVVIEATHLVPGRWLKCTSKYCFGREGKEWGDPSCKPCNFCRQSLVLEGSAFDGIYDSQGHQVECSGDDCGVHITCPAPLMGWQKVVAHVQPGGDGRYALSHARFWRLWP